LDFIKSKLKLSDQQVQEIEDRILHKYDYLLDAFEAVSRKAQDAIQNIELSAEVKNTLEQASKRIPIPLVEISGIMEMTFKKPDGIEIIKNALVNGEDNKAGAISTITYTGAPRCRNMVDAENFRVAERFMNSTIEKTRTNIEKQQGTFRFLRHDSKKSQVLQQAEIKR
jgi:translation initiation factor 2 subunit 1